MMKLSKRKKLALNTVLPLILEVVLILSGFVVPRLIMGHFGSEVNGLVSSIKHFLAIIAFFELGVGSVIRYNLYKPLAENDNTQLSKVIRSSHKFFNTLAKILLAYVVLLMLIYPYLSGKSFGHLYSATLIAAMSISYFARYFFGLVNQLLLTADQKGFIQSIAQILTIIVNTIVSVVLINLGASIHVVELSTSLIYLLRPLYLEYYVNRHYSIDRKIEYEGEPIKQKWNGLAQHISAVVLDNTDVIVLTLFSSLSNVSIYNAYHMVVYGIKKLINTPTTGIQARIGEMIARDEKKQLQKVFSYTEWIIHTISTYLFGCTAVLIVPFVMVYTNGINDANYNVPLFGLLITLANAVHSLRQPYSILILNGGYYKETQHNYIIVALINIVVSIALVIRFGLIGVAIGTVVAMLFQTIWMAYYTYRNVLDRSIALFWKQIVVDCIEFVCIFCLSYILPFTSSSYLFWIFNALFVSTLSLLMILMINYVAYKNQTSHSFKYGVNKIRHFVYRGKHN